jgi:hypothetical protein
MYADLYTLPKRFREIERFMTRIHDKYQLPHMTSYRSGIYYPTESHNDEIVIEGQGFYLHSNASPKIFHRGILHALTHVHDAALREIQRNQGSHSTLLAILAKHGILEEITNPGFEKVINKILNKVNPLVDDINNNEILNEAH